MKRLAAILAADMAGYSRLMGADEHATEAALEVARALFADEVGAQGGRIVHTEGDSVLAVLPTAAGALNAARAAQRHLKARADSLPEADRALFRIGVHVGDISEKANGEVFGDGVNIAARIQSLAEPGGIWLSDAVRASVRDRVDVSFVDEGEKNLKNIALPIRVFRVVDESGKPAASILASASLPPSSNLPFLDDALIGRGDDVAALSELVAARRLVTVVGAAGIGKTRLAHDVASRLVGKHSQGVWWVDLAAITSPDKVAPAIAAAAHLQLGEGDAVELLARSLALRDTLLVLDNCEHLTVTISRIVAKVLLAGAGVRVIATSQEALNARGEHQYRLDALAVPPVGTPVAAARTFGAVQLLEIRARAADRHFEITDMNLGEAIDLCRRLDGIPLAIEMAAARLPLLGLDGVRQRLDQRLQLLRGADREAPIRHQTLRAMLDGSYSLLGASEQAMLQRLSVFVGNFRIESALELVASDGADEWKAFESVTALADKSLLQVHRGDPPRYRLLETTRLYAWEQFDGPGARAAALSRHGVVLANLARVIERDFWRMPDAPWLERYGADYDDLQAAFDRAAERQDTAVAAPIGNALLRLDQMRNVNPVLRERAEIAHALIGGASDADAALLWNCVAPHGLLAVAAVPRFAAAREAVAAWRKAGSAADLCLALGFLGYQSATSGDHVASAEAFAEAALLEQASWPPRRRMLNAGLTAGAAIYREDADTYRQASRRELALAEEGGHDRAAAWAKLKLADAALMAGDRLEAIELGRAAVADLESLDQPSNLGLALSNLCAALLIEGDVVGALDAARRAFPLMWQNEWGYLLLDQVALIAALAARADCAARLLGFTDTWLKANGDRRQPNEARLVEMAVETVDRLIGSDERIRLHAEGESMSNARAEALARAVLADPETNPQPP